MTMKSLNSKLSVWFYTPVHGADQATGDDFISTRHVVLAFRVSQDLKVATFFGDTGEVVAKWPTDQIERLVWTELESELQVGSVAWRQKMQADFPSAYEPWLTEEDVQLRAEVHQGMEVSNMASANGRGEGAIRSRLLKLGLPD